MRRSKALGKSLVDLSRTASRLARKIVKANVKVAASRAPELRERVQQLVRGISSPVPAPTARAGAGAWHEGCWGIGPLAMRRYRLYLPPGASAKRPVPLVILLHGCRQDAASFAMCTRAAANARANGFAVLLPEQAPEANPQRCWNWFGSDSGISLEIAIIRAIAEHVLQRHPMCRDRIFSLGLSAGGAMAVALALRYPQDFAGTGMHSAAVPFSASNALEAGNAMAGRRRPDVERLRNELGRQLPAPLIVLHGERDPVVSPRNADALASLWIDLAHGTRIRSREIGPTQRGARLPYSTTDWLQDGQPYVRKVVIAGLGHAWSGGDKRQTYSDPAGPDALKLAWRYFSSLPPTR